MYQAYDLMADSEHVFLGSHAAEAYTLLLKCIAGRVGMYQGNGRLGVRVAGGIQNI